MILKKLNIYNYRNISDAELFFSPKVNCFIGNNGEGKTNVLDAIYFLSLTRSSTGNTDSVNIRHGESIMMVQGVYDFEGTEETIHCGLKSGQKKHLKRNGKEYKKLSEHFGLLPLVLVTPADSSIIAGGSDERRRFMDLVIAQYDNTYMNALTQYNKALQQRNAMLKADEEPNIDVLGVFEEMMALYGTQIYQQRQRFITEFTPVFQELYSHISNDQEKVELNYTSHCQRGDLLQVIQQDRMKDRIMGYSLHGIHRDDLNMTLGGYPLKNEGSQGQNKSFLIALKLAQFRFLCDTGSRTTPLLLLDDIFDKLDSTRVEKIVELVSGNTFGQIFITDTNRDHLDKILARLHGDYVIFNVHAGSIIRQQ